LLKEIDESKDWTAKVKLAHGYVADRASVFDVIERMGAGVKTSQAATQLLEAMQHCPKGGRYGSPDVRLLALGSFSANSPVSLSAITDYLRKEYAAEELEADQAKLLATACASDGEVSDGEWDYFLRVLQARNCVPCLRSLLGATKTDTKIRETRLLQALASPPAHFQGKPFPYYKELMPTSDPAFLVAIEPRLPKEILEALDDAYYEKVMDRFGKDTPAQGKKAFLDRYVKYVAEGGKPGSDPRKLCLGLARLLTDVEHRGGDAAGAGKRVCSCLDGPLKDESPNLANKSDLQKLAAKMKLPCGH
jgi:hypothetical protein